MAPGGSVELDITKAIPNPCELGISPNMEKTKEVEKEAIVDDEALPVPAVAVRRMRTGVGKKARPTSSVTPITGPSTWATRMSCSCCCH